MTRPSFTHVKLQKILYYVYCDFLKNGTTLFEEKIEKWQYGPVTPSIYNNFRSYGFSRITTPETPVHFVNDEHGIRFEREAFDPLTLNLLPEQLERINIIVTGLIEREAFELVELTHQESSWLRAQQAIKNGEKNIPYSEDELRNESYDIENLPEYDGNSYVIVNDNIPYFKEEEYTTTSFEKYSELDLLGRCGVASANISKDLMPTEKRGSIGMIKPSGWHTIKYDHIDGKYLYNRCHLIGYQLTGENANEKNLITCTRSMNTKGMLQFENMVTKYIKDTGNHVLYRVTPVFEGNNLVATGVEMEAYSVEDNGKGIKFNVFVYNIEDGIIIDYKTGDSKLAS